MASSTLSRGQLAPAAALILLVGSIGLGLAFVLALGFGYLPALGGDTFSAAGFRQLFGDPRLLPCLFSTMIAGIGATIAAVLVATALVAEFDPMGTASRTWPHRLAIAVLAVPHVSLALGLAFVLAPSGWILRALQALTHAWPLPPDWQLVPGESGLALALALFLKETPFLFVAMVMALHQIKPAPLLLTARTLGYRDEIAWVKLVLPLLYPLIRFPILAVLAYGLSVVDMSLILGPTAPPTLPVLILRWANDPDLTQRFLAASAALLQVSLVAGAILLWWLGERAATLLLRGWLTAGRRQGPRAVMLLGRALLQTICLAAVAMIVAALFGLAMWSIAEAWRYPALLPSGASLDAWGRAFAGIGAPLINSLGIASAATGLAIVLALACLEHEKHLREELVVRAEKWLFLPLLVPEVSFLLGLQVLLLLIGLNGTWLAVLWLHLLFVFPYVFLTLKEPWRAFDPRFERIGLALGQSPFQILWRIKLPLLRGAIGWAAAIGGSVSLSLYLPTVQGGEGRVVTLASEAVALSAGGDRRIVGVYGILQATVAGLFFVLALLAARRPRWSRR
nr:ABC transporter permease [uncultured Dongia sp.]